MSDTIFVQFMAKLRTRGIDNYSLANGFSDTYQLCKDKGDFVWIENASDLSYDRRDLIDKFRKDDSLDINKGTAYISALHTFNLYQAFVWAKQKPDVNFIVGGPAVNRVAISYDQANIPNNMIITDMSMEEHFGVPEFSQRWGIELPKMDDGYSVFFIYTLDNNCYWGKCIYCSYQGQTCKQRDRKEIRSEFLDLETDRNKLIWLQTNSLMPHKIKTVLPSLTYRDDIFYSAFVRGTKEEADVLEEVLDSSEIKTSNIKLCMGIEFPSKRMLKFMKKGVTKEGLLKMLEVADRYGLPMTLYWMLGWPEITEEDIQELEEFVAVMPRNKINDQKIFFISPMVGTELYNLYSSKKKILEIASGPFHCAYCVELNDTQKKMNERARQIILKDKYFTVDRYDIEHVGVPTEHWWRN